MNSPSACKCEVPVSPVSRANIQETGIPRKRLRAGRADTDNGAEGGRHAHMTRGRQDERGAGLHSVSDRSLSRRTRVRQGSHRDAFVPQHGKDDRQTCNICEREENETTSVKFRDRGI